MTNIPFPEAGGDAFLRLDVDDLLVLEHDYGDQYLGIVETGLTFPAQAIVARCLALALKTAPDEAIADAPWGLSLDELARRLNDAFHLIMYGKTVAEVQEERDQKARIAARKAAAEAETQA